MENPEQKVDLTNYSTEELKNLLKEKEAAENLAKEKDRKAYIAERDESVLDIIGKANNIQELIKSFKDDLHVLFDLHAERLASYGMQSKKSKGGFSLVHSSDNFKITRTRSLKPTWDERSHKALELIKDFLEDVVKKIDPKLFEILFSFIQKNREGDLEYSKVMHLISHRDKFSDERWIGGLDLLVESYKNNFRGYGYQFYLKGIDEQWETVDINFSSL